MLLYYTVEARNAGVLTAGLTPAWSSLKRLTSGFPNVTQPTIVGVGGGVYAFQYDAEVDGDAVGVIDLGGGISSPIERYLVVTLTRDRSRLMSAVSADGKVVASDLDDKEGFKLSADGLDEIEAEPGVPLVKAVAASGSVLAGVVSGSNQAPGGDTIVFYAMGNPLVPRVTVQATKLGNRPAVTIH